MRPRYLEIEGLQSFRDVQKIDFDRLSETGLFGIFGPTGSGKSTILDAVTLALFGEVQRAVSGTQGIINTAAGSVRVSFVFDLLKANVRKTYKVERTFSRKKGSENSCEAKIARLLEVFETGEQPVADKTREVTSRIEELLGLKYDDFTRAVVLPQNKFQEFLLMEKAKKREMLERIFYLEEYGRQLTDKVSRRAAETKGKLYGVQGALSALGDASDEALAEAEKRMKEAEAGRENAVRDLKLLEARFNEAREVWQLVDELAHIAQKEQEHLLLLNDINVKRIIWEKALKSEGLIEFIWKYKAAEKNLSGTEEQLKLVYAKLPGLEEQLRAAKALFDEKAKEIKEEGPRLVGTKTRLDSALDIKKEIDAIEKMVVELREAYKTTSRKKAEMDAEIEKGRNSILNGEANITAYKSEIEKLAVDIDYRNEIQKGVKLEDELNLAVQNAEVCRTGFNELSIRVSGLEKKLGEVSERVNYVKSGADSLIINQAKHLELKPGSRDEITAHIENYHGLKAVYDSLKSAKTDMDSINERIRNAKNLLDKQNGLLQKAGAEVENLEVDKAECRREVDRFRKLIEKNAAYMLSRSLEEGEPCPVCGSTHHPLLAAESAEGEIAELEGKLKNAEEMLAQKEVLLRNAENNRITLIEQVKNIEGQISQLSGDLDSRKREHGTLVSRLPREMQKLGLEELGMELEKLNRQSEDKLKAIGEWESSLEDMKNNLSRLNEQLSGFMVEENGIRAELQVNRENLDRAGKALNDANQVYCDKNRLYMDFLDRYKIQGAAAELKRINENERMIQSIQIDMEKQMESIQEIRKGLESLQTERQQLGNRFAEIEADGKNLSQQKKEKESKVKELAGDCEIAAEIAFIEKKLYDMEQHEKALQDNVRRLEEQYNGLSMQKNTLENQKSIYTANLEAEKHSVENALREKGFGSIGEVEGAVLPKEQLNALKEEIDEYEKVERNLQAQSNMILKKLDSRSITETEWNEISTAYREKAAERDEAMSRYEVAKSSYQTTKDKNERWQHFNRDFKELSRKSDMLDEIKSLLKGNSFIEYVAEERLRYIAKEASETLGIMTKHRYALELDTDNGFVICDNTNGGVHRMVTSLSGGETFLTALSLALALSKQIQLKGQSPLEFFFLDEGFGTLDSRLLDTVIDSLERLSTRERVIGLISHVPELRSRISRRLIVDPPASDGTGSMVRIEKA